MYSATVMSAESGGSFPWETWLVSLLSRLTGWLLGEWTGGGVEMDKHGTHDDADILGMCQAFEDFFSMGLVSVASLVRSAR